jgi:hypothetical protein
MYNNERTLYMKYCFCTYLICCIVWRRERTTQWGHSHPLYILATLSTWWGLSDWLLTRKTYAMRLDCKIAIKKYKWFIYKWCKYKLVFSKYKLVCRKCELVCWKCELVCWKCKLEFWRILYTRFRQNYFIVEIEHL